MDFDFSHINLPATSTAAPKKVAPELVCLERIQETSDTITFVFDTSKADITDYLPGQFILLDLEIDGASYQRAYTLSSSPSRPQNVAITVKRVAQGLVSNYLIDHLMPGMTVKTAKPSGEFYLNEVEERPEYIFVSAGSGITPVMSMSRFLLDNNPEAKIHFIHCCRILEDVIFADELTALSEKFPNFVLDLVLSKQRTTDHYFGRLNQSLFEQLTPNHERHTVYTCGPNAFMAMLSTSLQSRGFAMEHFHQESFGVEDLHQQANVDLGEEVSIEIPAFGKSITANVNANLLATLEKEGLPIVAACRSGVCGSCKCKVNQGSVSSSSQMTLTAEEISAGYVLACSSTIVEDLAVEIN